ncbi:hypothetical protein ACFLU6_03505 [Acidobacteriota bacterium]
MVKRTAVITRQEIRIQFRLTRFAPLLLVALALSFLWIAKARLPEWESGMGIEEYLFRIKDRPPLSETHPTATLVNYLMGGTLLAGCFLTLMAGLFNGIEIGGRERREGTMGILGIRPCSGMELVFGRFFAAAAVMALTAVILVVCHQVAFPIVPLWLHLMLAFKFILIPGLFCLALGMALGAVFVRPVPVGLALVFMTALFVFIMGNLLDRHAILFPLLEPAFLFGMFGTVGASLELEMRPGFFMFDLTSAFKSLAAALGLLIIAAVYQKVYVRDLSRLRLKPGRLIPSFRRWLNEWLIYLIPEPRGKRLPLVAFTLALIAVMGFTLGQKRIWQNERAEFAKTESDFNFQAPPSPEPLVSLQEIKLDVELRSVGRIGILSTLTVKGPEQGTDRIVLGLNPGLKVLKAEGGHGRALDIERQGHRLIIPVQLAPYEEADLRIAYEGRPRWWFNTQQLPQLHDDISLTVRALGGQPYVMLHDMPWLDIAPFRVLSDIYGWYPSPAFVRARLPMGEPDASLFHATIRVKNPGHGVVLATGLSEKGLAVFETSRPVTGLSLVSGPFRTATTAKGALFAAPPDLYPDPKWAVAIDEATELAKVHLGWSYGPPQVVCTYKGVTCIGNPSGRSGQLAHISEAFILRRNYAYRRKAPGFWGKLHEEDPLLPRRIRLLSSLVHGCEFNAIRAEPDLAPFFADAYYSALSRLVPSFCAKGYLPSFYEPRAHHSKRGTWWILSIPVARLADPDVSMDERRTIAWKRGPSVWMTLHTWLGTEAFCAMRHSLESLPGPVSLDDLERAAKEHAPFDLGRAVRDLLEGPIPEIRLKSVEESPGGPCRFTVTVESETDSASFAQVVISGAGFDSHKLLIPVTGKGRFSAETETSFAPKLATLSTGFFRIIVDSESERVLVEATQGSRQ